ncbi:MAG TPA: ABC transporter substrate-binding protein [Hyphomicrobiaceae bacterium]
MRSHSAGMTLLAALAASMAAAGCTNNPYPQTDRDEKVFYSSFHEAPKTLDPAVAYTTAEHVITGNVYDTLLEYHYLARPYRLIPGLAVAVPKGQDQPDGKQTYRFQLRPGVLFHADPCFPPDAAGRRTREVTAADLAFALARIADPAVNSPVIGSFAQIDGFADFSKKLVELRRSDKAFAALPVHEQYAKAGGIAGVLVHGSNELEIVLSQANAQILYWFAMPFTTPVAWEAVAAYDGKDGRDSFADHAVGTGPFRLALYEKQYRFSLARNELWYGTLSANSDAPGAVFPTEIDPKDIVEGRIDPAYAGRRLPFIDRVTFHREREDIPQFNKLLEGYYDDGGIIKESFDAVIQSGRLSPAMQARGMRLAVTVEPSIFYVGFNMEDPVVGTPGGERGRRLRQAMSVAVDSRQYLELFLNGRGLPAQTLLPPEIFGYDSSYKNPFRQYNVERARQLLADAGYKNGIDPATGNRLKLSFDTSATTAAASLQFEYLANSWRQIGLDVEINATTYNQFQDKVRRGAYQIFSWGWLADFPDPENFLFLLACENARSKNGGPNTASFCNAEFDSLYHQMKYLPNDTRRADLIRRMLAILERERPWIELYHLEEFVLSHAWLVNSKPMGISYPAYKYKDVRPELRARLRAEWNAPVRWPLYLVLCAIVVLAAPAVRTYYRERL